MNLLLLCDENVPYPVVEGLRRRGVDTVTVQEKGLRTADDLKIMQFAEKEERIIYTRDADFLRLHKSGISHAGIIYHHTLAYSIGDAIRKIMILDETLSAAELRGRIYFL